MSSRHAQGVSICEYSVVEDLFAFGADPYWFWILESHEEYGGSACARHGVGRFFVV